MDKNKVLEDLASLIAGNSQEIIRYNQMDLDAAKDLDDTLYDRLKVDEHKVEGMVKSVKEVMAKEDPEHKVLNRYRHPNGLLIENKVVPFGRILIIYESRPDVTIEAAISAFKAGNEILLKGGKEARNTNLYLVKLWHLALEQNNIETTKVTYLDLDRKAAQELIKNNTHRVDLVIPRGGEGLINFITSNTDIPVLVSGRGNNFVYIHDDANFDMAVNIVLDGKKRLSVCNAVDKVLFNIKMAGLQEKVQTLTEALLNKQIEVMGTEDIASFHERIVPVENETLFYEEFLAAKILLHTCKSASDAIAMINEYSGGHSAAIITQSEEIAKQFLYQVDAAAVYHNASTRFTDGGQFGFGAEMAISTQKLHFRGPIGLGQLVTNKWFVYGNGQIRN